jgi:hypothetical protein
MKTYRYGDRKTNNLPIPITWVILLFCVISLGSSLVTRGSSLESRVPSPETRIPSSVSSTELINNARNYDGKIVVYTGEAIGDVMVRGDFAWVNINDGENAIGVWLSRGMAEKIKFKGSFQSKGDQLEITGIFHRNCTMHGGDLDIHAQEIRTISQGCTVAEKLDITRRNLVYALLGVLLCIMIFVRHRKSKLRKTEINV